MKHPPLFDKILKTWMVRPGIIDQTIAQGFAAREPRPGWIPLKRRSTISDLLPPEAYAAPGAAEVLNKEMRKLHRHIKISAFMSGMSRSEVESHLEVHARLFSALAKHGLAQTTAD